MSTKIVTDKAGNARRINSRNINRSIAYAREAPSLPNLVRALYYYYSGNPNLGGENERGYDTGIAPVPGRNGGFRVSNVRDSYTRAKQAITTARNVVRQSPKSAVGHKQVIANKGDLTKLHQQNARAEAWTRGSNQYTNANNYAGAAIAEKPDISYAGKELTNGSMKFVNFEDRLKGFGEIAARNKMPIAIGTVLSAGLYKGGNYWLDSNIYKSKENTNSSDIRDNNVSTSYKQQPNKPSVNNTSANKPSVKSTTIDNSINTTTRVDTNNVNVQNTTKVNKTNTDTTKVNKSNVQHNVKVNKTNTNTNNVDTSNADTISIDIKKGDNLWNIAKKYTGRGINYKEILKYNDIKNPDLIYAGDKLNIPKSWINKPKRSLEEGGK